MTHHKVAFLFPGQGAQYPGMGQDFAEAFSTARELFEEANHLLKRDISSTIFNGPAELLTETRNSQVGIYLASMAMLRTVQSQFPQLTPAFCAGHSLGEYSAITAGGWISFQQGLPLVQYRGDFMNDACEKTEGTMAAVIGLNGDQVKAVVQELDLPRDLWTANFNCPGQVVISATPKGLAAATEALSAAGARRVLPLQVHGAFHSPLMLEAEERLADRVEETAFASSGAPVIMNVTAEATDSVDQMKTNLKQQVTRPVQWEQSIQHLMSEGVDLFVEIGCGRVLKGLNKRIGVTAPTLNIEKVSDLDTLATALNETSA